jgi:hypothetical protein
MPVESVAAYINNTFSLFIFILVCAVLFLLIFLTSAGIRKKVLQRNPDAARRDSDDTTGVRSFNKKDPFKKQNTALLGWSFIMIFLFMVLVLASYYFAINMSMGMTVFIICLTVLAMIVVLVYMFRSGSIRR